MTKQLQDSKRIRNKKRILSVTIRQMIDDSPDISYLGEYGNRPKTEYAIDRAHSEDCTANNPTSKDGISWLDRIEEQIRTGHIGEDSNYLTENDDAVLSTLQELRESLECDCGFSGQWSAREYRYFNPNSQNYAGLPEDEIRKYCRQDFDRMESLNAGDWCYIGIRAEAEIQTGSDVVQEITSGGLYGIESDSGKEHFEETIREELASLKTELLALGYSKRAIASAFKPENITEKND